MVTLQGRFEEAAQHLDEALGTEGRVLGLAHQQLGRVLVAKAGLLQRLGRYADAADALADTIEIFCATLDPEHPDRIEAELVLTDLPDRRDPARLGLLVEQLVARLGADHPRTHTVAGASRITGPGRNLYRSSRRAALLRSPMPDRA